MPVPGSESVRLLSTALVAWFGSHVLQWVGSAPDDDTDSFGWRLTTAPRYLFSISTHAGQLSAGFYDIQVSISDDTLENGEILFLDELSLEEVCALSARYDRGEVIERVDEPEA